MAASTSTTIISVKVNPFVRFVEGKIKSGPQTFLGFNPDPALVRPNDPADNCQADPTPAELRIGMEPLEGLVEFIHKFYVEANTIVLYIIYLRLLVGDAAKFYPGVRLGLGKFHSIADQVG